MRKKIINGFLMFAILLTTMSGVVSCKDHDADSYEDLKSQINKEITLRQSLEQQVASLKAFVESINSCKCNLEEALKDYLTKDEASQTYVTIEAYETSIKSLQDAIDKINATLGNIDPDKGTVAEQLNNLNVLIIQVKAIAEEAKRIAEEGKCECDLSGIEQSIKNLEDKIAGWDEQIKDLNEKAQEALARILVLENRITINEQNITFQYTYIQQLFGDVQNIYQIIQNLVIGGQAVDLSEYVKKTDLDKAKQEAMAECQKACKEALDALEKSLKEYIDGQITDVKTYINNQLKNYLTKTEIEQLIEQYLSNYYNKTEIDTKINAIWIAINALPTPISDYVTQQQLIDAISPFLTEQQIRDLIAQLTIFNPDDYYTKEEIDKKLNDILDKLKNLGDYVTKEEMENAIREATKDFLTETQILALIAQIEPTVTNNYYNTEEVTNIVTNFITNIYNNKVIENVVYNYLTEFNTTINNYITNNYYSKEEILQLIANITFGGDLTNYYTKAETDAKIEEILTRQLAGYYTKEQTEEKIRELIAEALRDYAKKEDLDGLQSQITEIKDLLESLNIPDTSGFVTTAQLETQLSNYYSKDDINTMLEGLDELKEKVNNMETTIKNCISDVIKNMVTGIILQGTINPIFGSVNVPVNMKTMMLCNYWGKIDSKRFPYATPVDYTYSYMFEDIQNTKVKYPEAIAQLSAGTILGGDTESAQGYLGKLYMTINPAEVDFNGMSIDGLYTSGSNKKAPVEIRPLTHSNTDLTFGLTRSNDNGFYEAGVYVDRSRLDEVKLNMNLKELARDVKDVIQNRDKSSVLSLGASVFNNIQNVLPAYGAKVQWQDETTGITRSLYSDYSVGVSVFKAFSFDFLDGDVGKKIYNTLAPNDKIRGVGRLENFVARIAKEVKTKLHNLYPNIDPDKFQINFKDITFGPEGSNADIHTNADGQVIITITVRVTATAQGQEVSGGTTQKDESGNPLYTFTIDIPATDVTGEATGNADVTTMITELVEAINERFGEGSQVATAFNSLQELLEELIDLEQNIDDMVTDYEKRVDKFITRVNNKLIYWLDKGLSGLHPTMVASTGNKTALMSHTRFKPTKTTSSSVTLFPSTYTLETIAPAYKKFAAVTNVYDADGNQIANYEAEARAANGANMATVYSGKEKCTLNGKSGYIYEVTYAAVDFAGKIWVDKYYIQFK